MRKLLFGFLLLTMLTGGALAATHTIVLTWSFTQNANPAVGFNVYRGTISGGPYNPLNTSPIALSTLTYTDSTGVGGTKYYYVVRSVDSHGIESANSPEGSGTMLQDPPNPPTAITVTAN